jgi:fructoselysine-6-P-deglycase FrlB-like protein
VIGVSHEGGSRATNDAMRAAGAAGARVGTITVTRRSPGGALAEPDLVLETDELDQSWCHTVAYLSALLAATAIGARISGQPVRVANVRELVTAGASSPSDAERLAAVIGNSRHVIVTASGADRAAGRELVLKIEEASWLPSAFRELETLLHGHLPATGSDTSLVLLLADRSGRDVRIARARQMLAAADVIGVRAGAILSRHASGSIDDSLTPAGRIVVPDAPELPAPVAALLSTATALQLLTERIARVRGTNPDAIRRDDERYRRSAAAAE